MLYEINKKYYILVDGIYKEVKFVIKNDNVMVEIDYTKETIKKTNSIIAKSVQFDDDFKNSKKLELIKSKDEDDKEIRNSRYNKR
jgi:hypothetical protein